LNSLAVLRRRKPVGVSQCCQRHQAPPRGNQPAALGPWPTASRSGQKSACTSTGAACERATATPVRHFDSMFGLANRSQVRYWALIKSIYCDRRIYNLMLRLTIK
jgi:hypothetical protein